MQKKADKPIWKKNLFALSVAVSIAGISFSEVMPFLPPYIDILGHFTHQQLNFWSGFIFSGIYFISTAIPPWWGELADKKGKKLMILRASLGMAIVLGSMDPVTNIWQLLFPRMLQGVFAGFVSSSNALIATKTPRERSGQALRTMSSASTAGNLLGPFLGGTPASAFSYRVTFFITGGLLLISFPLSLFLVHEEGLKPITEKKLDKASSVTATLHSPALVFGLLLTTLIIQAANNSIDPIISLHAEQLMSGNGNVVFVSGIIVALPGITTFLAASRFGALGDRIGTHKIIIGGFISTTILFFLTVFVRNTVQLGILRFLVGFIDAYPFPQVQTLLIKNSPAAVTGRTFSWNQSVMYIGNTVGPLLGSFVAGISSYSMILIVTAAIVILNLILFNLNVVRNLVE